ncbi:MAG TPA: hypothetical protein VM261_31045 [Kofleriaceae bacterium]|nr:hypothetical protein [Kofleriaceae bacterium]
MGTWTMLSALIENMRKAQRARTQNPDDQPRVAVHTVLGGPIEGQLVKQGEEGFVLDVSEGANPGRHVFVAMRHVVLVTEAGAPKLL